eukprot:CAMPEP_0177596466 /NCGR_PEP_ID=MMETSP0419_2-20121207/11080_1 /TAXON_ID=582737 /ORGANISM="Tetraselmis sp., Strain GSL018" /LENGTH=313 /DNA_ID=CAMNT_0019088345 /DNA_START=436 /DNA_END=1380 /DNA_ORIENTATION=+
MTASRSPRRARGGQPTHPESQPGVGHKADVGEAPDVLLVALGGRAVEPDDDVVVVDLVAEELAEEVVAGANDGTALVCHGVQHFLGREELHHVLCELHNNVLGIIKAAEVQCVHVLSRNHLLVQCPHVEVGPVGVLERRPPSCEALRQIVCRVLACVSGVENRAKVCVARAGPLPCSSHCQNAVRRQRQPGRVIGHGPLHVDGGVEVLLEIIVPFLKSFKMAPCLLESFLLLCIILPQLIQPQDSLQFRVVANGTLEKSRIKTKGHRVVSASEEGLVQQYANQSADDQRDHSISASGTRRSSTLAIHGHDSPP